MNQFPIFVRDTLMFFKAHFLPLCALVFPFAIPVYFIEKLVFPVNSEAVERSAFLLLLLVEFISSPILVAVILQYIVAVFAGEKIDAKAFYIFAFKNWGKLIVLGIMVTSATIAGLLLVVVPGVIISSRLLFAQIYCVLRDKSAKDAFMDSWDNTKEYQWLLIASLLCFVFGSGLITAFISFVLNALGLWVPAIDFIINIFHHLFSCIAVIYMYRVFSDYEKNLKSADKTIDNQ